MRRILLLNCLIALVLCMLFPSAVRADVTLAPIADGAPKTLAELRAADPAAVAALPRFDSRDYGIVPPVKDQGSSDLCWAYAAAAASEASILRAGIDPAASQATLSLSPEALGFSRYNRGADPLKNTKGYIDPGVAWRNKSGVSEYGAALWSQWCGPVKNGEALSADSLYQNTAYFLQNAIRIPNANDRDAIKRAIVQYGAVTFSYNNISERDYHNASRETGSASYPHACAIVGWDDSIPAGKFSPGGASQDGGWIIKNSYHSLPYFYLSYDCGSDNILAFEYAPPGAYRYNYFYDGAAEDFGLTLSTPGNRYAANIFQAKKGTASAPEYIKAVNVGIIGKNAACEVTCYVDLQAQQDVSDLSNLVPDRGTLAAKKTETFTHDGYYTIVFDQPVQVTNGSYFSIAVRISNANNTAVVRLTQDTPNMTYLNKDYWFKSQYAARIKAFTAIGSPAAHIALRPDGSATAALPQAGNYLVVFATYRADGALADVALQTLTAADAGEQTIAAPAHLQSADKLSVMLWKDFSSLQPLCSAASR